MSDTEVRPEAEPLDGAPAARSVAVPVAVLASIGAGLVHAGVIGAHADHVTLARLFMAAAVAQLAVGVAALVRPSRLAVAALAFVNAACVAAWAVTRLTAVTMVGGLEVREDPAFADTACAVLGLLAVGAAFVWWRRVAGARSGGVRPAGFALPALAVAVLAVPALAVGSTHTHAHDHAVARPFDPTRPVDLGGTPGVSQKQQRRAEDLVRSTLADLPRFADPAVARAEGWQSIGDGLSGFEHYIKWSLIDDGTFLDPTAPESLVYQVTPTGRTLVSAMFIMPPTYTLETVPDVGGALTQWHLHDDLCFTPLGPKGARVVGLTRADGSCAFGQKFMPAPMLHVWITPNACGPFAALEGVGAGQVRAGETRLCDHAHGSTR